jgi:ketosteroid isomerase-like protein
MAPHEQDRDQIAAVVEQYRWGFATLDAAGLLALWDQDHDPLIYVAQELAQPVRGWTGIAHYYQRVAGLLEHVTMMEVRDVSVDLLGDVAAAFFSFHFEGAIRGQPHSADGRVTCLLHRTRGTWKVIHYHESRPPDQAE